MDSRPMKQRYELEKIPIDIRGRKLEFLSIKDWTPFIEQLSEKNGKYVENFPFWIKIWESSIMLADTMIPILKTKSRILEIGAGMGITGLFLSAFGHQVTVTEYESEALELLRLNVEHNGLDSVSINYLDWNDHNLQKQFDVVCVSEILYNNSFIEPIKNLISQSMKTDGLTFFAHDLKRKTMMDFINSLGHRFKVKVQIRNTNGSETNHGIMIHRISLNV